jgi:DNA anti-recombination protein RmuC
MKKTFAFAACLLLGGCMQAADPKDIAQQYWQAMQTGDYAKARSMVSSSTQPSFDQYAKLPANEKTPLNAVALTDTRAVVTTIINTGNSSVQFNTVMVLDNGQWEVDANETHIPPATSSLEQNLNNMLEQLSSAMDGNVDQMKKTLSKGVNMLNDVVQNRSQEISESVNDKIKQLNQSIQDAMKKLEQRRQQKTPAPDKNNVI